MYKVKHTGTTYKPYTVKGDTLDDIWKSIEKKGPKAHGKNVAGLTTCPVTVNKSSVKMDHEFTESKKDGIEAKIWHKAITLEYKCTIKIPQLASDKKLSKAAKKEWKRFMAKLKTHEQGHVEVTGKEASSIGEEIDQLKFVGTGENKRAAFDAAVKTFKKEFPKKYSTQKVEERLDKAHKKFHATKGHGPNLDRKIK